MTVGEWDQRQLCPDGGCVGVIGPDGTCKVCGHAAPNWGDERTRGLNVAADDVEDDEDDEDDDDDLDDADEAGVDDDAYDDDDDDDEEDEDDDLDREPVASPGQITAAAPVWVERELCDDGACIGVIGDDGRCKVCGKPAPGAVARVAVAIETPAAIIETTDAVQTVDTTIHTTDAPADPDSKADA